MGTKMAPAYANIFMAELEEGLLRNYHTTPILWKRYIDDILCIWPGPPDSLKEFIRFLNGSHRTIKFTYECSETTVDFLDVTIYKGKRYHNTGILDFKPFFKKTNKFQYLEYSSSHPRNTFGGIVRGELTRLLRACSDKQEYLKIQRKMYQIFRDRNYPKTLLERALESVPFESRPQTLEKKEKSSQKYDTFLVVEYTPDLDIKQLRQTLKPNQSDEKQVPTPCLSLKRPKNLSQKLVRAKLRQFPDPPQSTLEINIPITPNFNGNSAACATPGCKCCRRMSRKPRVTSNQNNKTFPTPKHTNCQCYIPPGMHEMPQKKPICGTDTKNNGYKIEEKVRFLRSNW